jgi:4-amino-4-deoxy-L-arabinose transferase-like glycosyltransferase
VGVVARVSRGVHTMTSRVVAACTALLCILYIVRLHDTPAAIGGDEAFFANHAYAIATTGRDLNGRVLPLVVQLDRETDPGLWYQAMLVYVDAAAFLVLPFTEWSARLPVALLAIVNIALIAVAARRYVEQRWAASLAAFVLAVSPIYFFLSRQALDYICPITFVIVWLHLLSRLHERPHARIAFACGLILGAGLFSYISSWLMMPIYLLCTWALCMTKPGAFKLCAAAATGFLIPAALLAAWLLGHQEAWSSLFNRYGGGSGQLPGLNINGYYRVVDFVAAYWSCWNPAQLFLTGSSNPTIGVRVAGVFAAPVAILFVAGLLSLRARPLDMVLLAGLLTSPLGPVLYGTPGAIQRQLVLLPFVAIVAARGAERLLHSSSAFARSAAIVALAATPLVFAYAAYDAFAERDSYVTRFDPSNFRDLTPALAVLNREISAPQVVLAIGPYDRRAYWRFHTQKLRDPELRDKAIFWEPSGFQHAVVREHSLIVAVAPSPLADRLDRACPRVASLRGEGEVVVWRANVSGCAPLP